MDKGPSDKLFRGFFKRHEVLTEKVPQLRDKARIRMSNAAVMDGFFKLYGETLDDLDIRNKEDQIFYCDETGFSDKDGSKRKVIAVKGEPAIQQVTTHDHVTAHMCVCGDGRVLPTFIIYEGSFPHRNYKENVPHSWLFGTSPNGYMDKELFSLWFKKIFIPNCGSKRPVLLLLDNHDSHISLDIIDMARDNQIEILGFPAHTTHILQPLDVEIFGPLKERLYSIAVSLSLLSGSSVIGRAKLPTVLSYAIDQKCTPALIKSAFKKSGLIPFDSDATDEKQLVPNMHRKDFKLKSELKEIHTPQQLTTDPQPSTSTSCIGLAENTSSQPTGTSSSQVTVSDVHPILSIRNLPSDIQSLFHIPASHIPAEKRHRILTQARVITGDEMKKLLETKEKEEKEKREGIERRKKEREEKRSIKERERKERQELKKTTKKEALKRKASNVGQKKKVTQIEMDNSVESEQTGTQPGCRSKRKRNEVNYRLLADEE